MSQAWSWRWHLGDDQGPSGWIRHWASWTGVVFADERQPAGTAGAWVVAIIGPLWPTRPGGPRMLEAYRLRGTLTVVKAKVVAAVEHRDQAWRAWRAEQE